MPPTATAAIQALRAEGLGMLRIAKHLGWGVSTVQCSCPNPPPAEERLTGADSAPFDNDHRGSALRRATGFLLRSAGGAA